MKYTVYNEGHTKKNVMTCDTLLELATRLKSKFGDAVYDLCCVEDADGFGYNPGDLVDEFLTETA